ncbi:MAG: YccF domain-containing protein [Anaerolineae bacterium]
MGDVVVQRSGEGPGCLIQLLWFLFIGWWVGQLWIAVAWFLMAIIVGIPLGVKMMNKVPQVIALRNLANKELVVSATEAGTVVTQARDRAQHNIILRAIYFVLIGWWFSAIWIEVAYLACLTIIGLPLGFAMFDKTPAIVSLHR